MQAMYQAINMPLEEREKRAQELVRVVEEQDINHWIYRQLEAEGIITTQPGSGTFVAKSYPGLTLSEKRRQVSRRVRELVVEAGRIGLDYQELLKLVEREVSKIRHKERKP